MPELDEAVRRYYERGRDVGRLQGGLRTGPLEFLRTKHLLERFLPAPPLDILDVGGGPGAYAAWLCDRGYRVHVVDPIPLHVEQAKAAHTGVTGEVGDGRDLRRESGAVDAVLLLGPLYHLVERADRMQALAEARRVLRPGGVLIAAAITEAKVDRLIPLYAIGVFTSFTLSQAGMARHHIREKEPHRRKGLVVNGIGAVLSAVVDVIIAITKFKHGAWVIVVLVPIMVVFVVRLARQYELEASHLEHGVPEAVTARVLRRHVALVFVDTLDLAAARAIQYARTLTPDDVRAVHFVIDAMHAEVLAQEWQRLGLNRICLELVDRPDRRLSRCAVETVARELAEGETEVSVLLPDRKYRGFWHRILHDRTAEDIERNVSLLPHANVTTVPFHFDVRRTTGEAVSSLLVGPRPPETAGASESSANGDQRVPAPAPPLSDGGRTPIDNVRQYVRVEGRIRSVRVQPRV
ncbi:MAG: class I SAM-dependent methyltransferase, partial [Actinobacteria bacterium]|nr:class I SAM-dependent methyltransferase [Actinomycetota bacterium]